MTAATTSALRARSAHQVQAHKTTDWGREIHVLVIGESSRYDRWRLNGYERDTNPLLSQESNLVMLPDVRNWTSPGMTRFTGILSGA